MSEYVSASEGNFTSARKNEMLAEMIGDLEQSLDANKGLFKDIIQSKKSNLLQNSEESNANFMISSKALEIVQLENNRLLDAIGRMTNEVAYSETLIAMSEERAKQSRVRRKESNFKIQEDIKNLKNSVQAKEEEVRRLEKYYSGISDLLGKNLKQEVINPSSVVAEGKKVIKKLTKQFEAAEDLKDLEIVKCREAEAEIQRIQSLLRINSSKNVMTTDKILSKSYMLNVNYENFWLLGVHSPEELSDSIRSSISSVQDQQFPSKFIFSSKAKPNIPKLNFPTSGAVKEKKQDSPESKVSKLELAYQIKCEETQSLIRLLNELQAIEDSLTAAVEHIKS